MDKMSAEKLSSDKVPQKFIEWLLNMGCSQEKIPPVDKVEQECRGYYMVWRSLMTHVQPKDEVRLKRLNVFCDDVRLCQKKNVFNEKDPSVVIPEQLILWRQQQEVRKKVALAEGQVTQVKQDLRQLMDKVSSRICQRDISRKKVEDKQRRIWLLRQVAAELPNRKANLEEAREITNSLCSTSDDDLQNKVDKCLVLLGWPYQPSNAANSSAVSSQEDDIEDQLSAVARARGDALWAQLCERRAALNASLAHENTIHSTVRRRPADHRSTAQSVIAHTASLHCSLSLEAMKNRVLVKQTRARLAALFNDLNDYVTGVSCELLVLRGERANTSARVCTQRTLLDEIATSSGVFELPGDTVPGTGRRIADIDKTIEASRDEIKRLILALAATERKIHSTKEVLQAVFNSFQSDTPIDRYKGVQLDFPDEPIGTLCRFYEQERERRRSKADLSLDFDTSGGSFDSIDLSNPRFIDELRFYLKKFELEKNRKLVMESGEKNWIFETLQASLERMRSKWLHDDVTVLLCPSISLSGGVQKIISQIKTKEALEKAVKEQQWNRKLTFDIDITEKKEQEEAAIDIIKKKIGENLQSLHKSTKLMELDQKNLELWRDDTIKTCISNNRTVNGKTYKEYEALYIESLS